MYLKISSVKRCPFCLGLSMLWYIPWDILTSLTLLVYYIELATWGEEKVRFGDYGITWLDNIRVRVSVSRHNSADICLGVNNNRWVSARLQYLQCVNSGYTAVVHLAIDISQIIERFTHAGVMTWTLFPYNWPVMWKFDDFFVVNRHKLLKKSRMAGRIKMLWHSWASF